MIDNEKMLYRVEFHDKQQCFHLELEGKKNPHPEFHAGWVTIARNKSDKWFKSFTGFIESGEKIEFTVNYLLRCVEIFDAGMNFIKLTKRQYQDLLKERVQFEFYDGDYWYVSAQLDNNNEFRNNGVPYKLRICLHQKEDKSLTFFNNDRLCELLYAANIVDVAIITEKSEQAINNYKEDK